MRSIFKLFIIFFITFSTAQVFAAPNPEASQKVRDGVVFTQLKAHPNTVLVYAKGLCCPSCAIGIRKKVKTLSFVDLSRFNDGVELDAKHQLVTIALKLNQKVDIKALSLAIDDAGYTPVHVYTFKDDKVVTTQLGGG
jgi:copper chaperone CopZ